VVITLVDLHYLSSPAFQHHFCAQFYHFRMVNTEHPVQRYENNIHGSTDCAGNSIHCVCCRNTSTQRSVVLNIITFAMHSYTQLQHKTPYTIFLIIHKYFILGVKQCWPKQSLASCHILYKDPDTWPVLFKIIMFLNNFAVKQTFQCTPRGS